ncbi:hypothetical protein MRX96_001562 [Rhipicephalus microplus]
MKLMGGRTVSAKVRLQRQVVTEVTGACRRTLGRHGRYGAAIPTSLARHREWYKYMVPTTPPDENDWPEDCVWESEASETTCHEGQWGLNKLGKAGKCGATVPTLVIRQRERHNFIIPLLLLDETDGPEDRVCKCEASETAGHGGQRGLLKETGQTRQIWGHRHNIAGQTPRVVQVHDATTAAG